MTRPGWRSGWQTLSTSQSVNFVVVLDSESPEAKVRTDVGPMRLGSATIPVVCGEFRSLHQNLLGDELDDVIGELLAETGTHLTDICGIAAVTATDILAAIGDIDRFPTEAHLAAFAGAAPRQIASAAHSRHRLSRGGPRRLRRAFHWAAFTQARQATGPGRAYYLRKRDEGKTHRKALRCFKRQIIKTIWHTKHNDAQQKTFANTP